MLSARRKFQETALLPKSCLAWKHVRMVQFPQKALVAAEFGLLSVMLSTS